ncbi:MAG: LysR family transcriptional regulator [Acidobacteriaceae bacterium]|nr:LysR family transcriptional regulator [Acidobacteriaceae bacterium]
MSDICGNGPALAPRRHVLELRTLSAFVTVAEKRSFVQAASALHLSQPAITAQIQRLEQELGVLLFDRTRRTVQLTHAGEAFLDGARDTLATAAEAAQAAQRAAQLQTLRLRFGFPPSASREIVPNITTEFHRRCPHVKLDLFSFHTSITVAELQSSSLDIGFVRLPVEAKGLRIIPAHHEPLVLCLPEGHPLAEAPHISIADLRNERFIMYGRKWAPGYHDHIVERCLEAGFQPVVSNVIDEMYLGPSLVAAGEGIAILPSMVVNSPSQKIVVRELHLHNLRSEMGIATRLSDESPITELAVKIAREVCLQYSLA